MKPIFVALMLLLGSAVPALADDYGVADDFYSMDPQERHELSHQMGGWVMLGLATYGAHALWKHMA
jgi:hypothetical protein